jgi:hypothetical protein
VVSYRRAVALVPGMRHTPLERRAVAAALGWWMRFVIGFNDEQDELVE